MSRRRSRFLHIESARPAGSPGERARLQGGGRFVDPVAPGAAAPERVPSAHVERFRDRGDAPLAAQAPHPEEMPFQRCARCEMDNSRYVSVCSRCGAHLETPQQRAFNAALWQVRRREEARERAELEALAEARPGAGKPSPAEVEGMLAQQRREERRGGLGWLVRWREASRARLLLLLLARLGARRLFVPVLTVVTVCVAVLWPRGSIVRSSALLLCAAVLLRAVRGWLRGRR